MKQIIFFIIFITISNYNKTTGSTKDRTSYSKEKALQRILPILRQDAQKKQKLSARQKKAERAATIKRIVALAHLAFFKKTLRINPDLPEILTYPTVEPPPEGATNSPVYCMKSQPISNRPILPERSAAFYCPLATAAVNRT